MFNLLIYRIIDIPYYGTLFQMVNNRVRAPRLTPKRFLDPLLGCALGVDGA